MIEEDWDIGWAVAGGSSAAEMPFSLFSPVEDIEEGSALAFLLTMCLVGGYIREVALFLVGLSENIASNASSPPTDSHILIWI